MEKINEVLKNYQPNTKITQTYNIQDEAEITTDIYDRLRVDKNNTLESFKKLSGTENVLKAIKGLLNGERQIMMIYGGVGNGKTHLLHGISIELYKRGLFTRVYVYSDMLNTLKMAMNRPDMDYNNIIDRYCLAERLIVDDIGAGGSDTEYSDKVLEQIIVARYGRGLFTVMSTNRKIDELPERVVSRLKDRTVCYLVLNKSADYRPNK